MCQIEKTTKKKQIHDSNNPVTPCHLDKLKYDLLFFLAKKFGYHDRTTSCSCKNKKQCCQLVRFLRTLVRKRTISDFRAQKWSVFCPKSPFFWSKVRFCPQKNINERKSQTLAGFCLLNS